MELEHRVKILEQEVKILKNQIQATLLDIQAHVLNDQHPVLRAEAGSQGPSVQQMPEPSEIVPTQSQEPFLPETRNTDGPVVRKVSTHELETEESFPAAEESFPAADVFSDDIEFIDPVSAEPDEQIVEFQEGTSHRDIDWATFTLLANWASNSIGQMGVDRTEKLIRAYAGSELMSPELTSALLEFISLHDEDGSLAQPGVEETIQRISVGLDTLQEETVPQQANGHQRDLILRLISGIQDIDIDLEENRYG